ncbi:MULTISPECIES: DUF2269 domain-containing protein [unclassified Streptomyces]|uniref:DUF2269 domain-containing protein n=1 Tax=unclassified Streptomyces TaxID=2593676 RepID=UPI000B80BE09|nr:DUF2269 domain-containing protein [Streptomyces sp. DvalAA-43]MYQ87862.1 DUF2269 domain-containing protein [Streptomyces sp. SID4936]
MKPLKRSARRSLLVAHVAVSVSWLGLTVGLLALAIAALSTADPATAGAATRAMKIFGDWLVVPVSLFSLFSGLVLALGTPWGLARHRWVWTKFWLTLITVALSVFSLRPGIDEAAARGTVDIDLVIAPSVATATYLFITAISVLKPWGPTRRGRRLRRPSASGKSTSDKSASGKRVDVRTPGRTA